VSDCTAEGLKAVIMLQKLDYTSQLIDDSRIKEAPFESSFILLTVTDDCPNLKRISFHAIGLILESDVIDAFASLPNLNYLNIGRIDVDAVAKLSRCARIKHLHIYGSSEGIDLVLPKIGKNLTSLSLKNLNHLKKLEAEADIALIRSIVDHCPDLESLSVEFRLRNDLKSPKEKITPKRFPDFKFP
jgi:hypothetical protein